MAGADGLADRAAGHMPGRDIVGMIVGRRWDYAWADASSSGWEGIRPPWAFAAVVAAGDGRPTTGRVAASVPIRGEGMMRRWRPRWTERLPNGAPG